MSETHSHVIDIAAATEQAHVLAQALPFLRRYAGVTVPELEQSKAAVLSTLASAHSQY